MKELEVPVLKELKENRRVKYVAAFMDNLPKHAINHAPWPKYPYCPEVSFSIGHDNECIYLKYYVIEEYLKACYFHSNDPVYKDSCVELFITLDGEKGYYNFEFNAIGTCLL